MILRRTGFYLVASVYSSHPGNFHNTEEPQPIGIYHESLRYCYRIGAASLLPRDVLRIVDGMVSARATAPEEQV